VGPRTGLIDLEERKFLTLLGLELGSLGRPARSQSLYRLRYPGSPALFKESVKLSKVYTFGPIGFCIFKWFLY
jgi:hypothetical protein